MTAAFQINAFQPDAFQTLTVTGVINTTDQNDSGAFVGVVQTAPIVIIDTHDGGNKKRKKEAEKEQKRKNDFIALFEHVIEGKPLVAEEVAAPYIKQATISELKSIDLINQINFDALMTDLVRVQQIYDAYIEMDDEEVLALL